MNTDLLGVEYVANKNIDNKEMPSTRNADYLKTSLVNMTAADGIFNFKSKHGDVRVSISMRWDHLGMDLDATEGGKVQFNMVDFLKIAILNSKGG